MKNISINVYSTGGYCNKCGCYFESITIYSDDALLHKVYLCDKCKSNKNEKE